MSLLIEVAPEVERHLQEAAERHGLPLADYARGVLENHVLQKTAAEVPLHDYNAGIAATPGEVEEIQTPAQQGAGWDVLESLVGSIDGPPDWASEHDHYLYGTPKRGTVA